MDGNRRLLGTVHETTHRVPGVPAHVDRAAGHQGRTRHGRRSPGRTWHHHSPARRPRVLVAWQRRIAALFGQEP